MASPESNQCNTQYPRITITFCTQCRWMLRAAYFGQELLSTFSTAIGEVALIPATGGIFTVHLYHRPQSSSDTNGESSETVQEVLLWDRKAEGGFPETKILKQRLRNYIEPGRDLGHSDKPSSKAAKGVEVTGEEVVGAKESKDCEAASEGEGKVAAECEDCK